MKIDIAIQQANVILKRNSIKSSLLDSEILISKAINKSREYENKFSIYSHAYTAYMSYFM